MPCTHKEYRSLLKDTIAFLQENFSDTHLTATPILKDFLKPKGSLPVKPVKKAPLPLPQPPIKKAPIVPPAPIKAAPESLQEELQKKLPPAKKAPPLTALPTPPTQVPPPAFPFLQLKELVEKVLPELTLVPHPLEDSRAKKIASGWQEKLQGKALSILSCGETGKEKAFLQHLTSALEVYFSSFPLSVQLVDGLRLEKEARWDLFLQENSFELIIASPLIANLSRLLPFYREIPHNTMRYLKDHPLFLLAPLSTYLQNPLSKKALWNTLCQLLPKKDTPPSS